MNCSGLLIRFVLFIFIFLLIMNPYTIIGGLGLYVALFFLFSFFIRGLTLDTDNVLIFLGLVVLSLYGVFISYVNGIGQLEHFKVAISLLVYVLVARSLFIFATNRGLVLNDLLLFVFFSIVLNSTIVLCEFYFSGFRDFVEFFLIPSGNVDWTEGFRYRGLASGGGASLSILIPVSFVLALYLFKEKVIGFFSFSIFSLILIGSLLLIGRSGLLLLPFAILFFLLLSNWKNFLRFAVLGFSIATIFMLIFGYIYSVLENKYGADFVNYSFGFLLEGREGIRSEGTVSIILGFLQVVPTSFPEVFTGFGFYGGSDFEPWTDSGYARMFLSIGFPAGIIFYIIFSVFVLKAAKINPLLVFPMFFILVMAEAKEPLLLSGYSSRVFVFILVFIQIHSLAQKNKLRSNIGCRKFGGQK